MPLQIGSFLCSRNWYVGECCTDPLTRFWRDKSAQSHFTKHFKVPKFSQNCFKFFSKLIHSPGPDVTRVHSHRDKLGNKLRTNANKTLDSFVTSFIWNNVSCFILIWWGPVLQQWIIELTDVVKTVSFDVHDSCCQPQVSAFVCFCHESEIARQLDRKVGCGWAHGIHYYSQLP